MPNNNEETIAALHAMQVEQFEMADRISHWKALKKANKRKKKNLEEIYDFLSLFPRKVCYIKGKKKGNLKWISSWIDDDNARRYVPVKMENEKGECYNMVAVEADYAVDFPVQPTAIISGKKKYQYIWVFKTILPAKMKQSVQFLANVIEFLQPECKTLMKSGKGLIVPGIVGLGDGRMSHIVINGPLYDYQELWNYMAKDLPVRGKSLRKYIKSDKIYVPNVAERGTKGYLGIQRFNNMLSLKFTKEEFEKIKTSFLFWTLNFIMDAGVMVDDAFQIIRHWTDKYGYKVTDEDLYRAIPHRSYKITNKKIIEIFGEKAAKVFSVSKRKAKGQWKNEADDIRKKIATLAMNGHSIKEIAEILGKSISLVKRRRSEAVKLGYISLN